MIFKIKSILLLLSASFWLNNGHAQVVQGDNLGAHKATQDLNMQNKNVTNSSGMIIGAAAFTGSNTSIALEISGTNKALLLPRVTNLTAITSPLSGMMVYCSADNQVYIYQGNSWVTFNSTNLASANILVGDANNIPQPVSLTGDVTLTNAGVATIGTGKVTTEKFAAGSVNSAKIALNTVSTANIADEAITTSLITAANVTSAKIADGAITESKIAANAIMAAKINSATNVSRFLTTNATGSTSWTLQTALTVPALTNARIIVGNASSIPTAVSMSGDITISNTGTTSIGSNKITSAKILTGTIGTEDLADNAVTAAKLATVVNNAYLTTTGTGVNAWAALPVEEYAIGDVKAWLPTLVGTALPTGWVECNGQTLVYSGSTLNGKVIPNLNNNNYLIGNTSPTTTAVGSTSLTLTRANLPNSIINGNAPSEFTDIPGTVSGSVTVNNDAGHTHGINDPGHTHGRLFWNSGGWKSYGSLLSTDRNNSSNTVEYSLSAKTGITLNGVGEHNHTASFTGTPAAHTHALTLSSINGGVTQTPVDISPNSVTVRWIMRVL